MKILSKLLIVIALFTIFYGLSIIYAALIEAYLAIFEDGKWSQAGIYLINGLGWNVLGSLAFICSGFISSDTQEND